MEKGGGGDTGDVVISHMAINEFGTIVLTGGRLSRDRIFEL
jgi:hypothetical protein